MGGLLFATEFATMGESIFMALTKKEETILKSIVVPSESNPDKPEFPPEKPQWPSTPVYKIEVPGFKNVWIKDESVNPTGTHKDRMAWEMVVTYRALLQAKKRGQIKTLPALSIISSGSAALAVQTMLKKYQLPNLKVLIDYNIDKNIRDTLEGVGCEIYEADLSKRVLYTQDILSLTNNEGGIDITSDDALGPFDVFYDWLSYDVVNQDADYVFVPYGTGHLFENIVNVAKRESSAKFFHDKRYKGDAKKLREMNFVGATTNNPNTIADKLYSPHLPFVHFDTHWIQLAKKKGYIGEQSNVYVVQERYIKKALEIADKNNVTCEPSGVAGLGMLLQMKNKLPKTKKYLVVSTGNTKL